MENRLNLAVERDHPSSCSSSCNGGVALTHKTITRSEINACPTTFIQADTSSFKQVVQMLTGSSETTKQGTKSADPPSKTAIPPIKTGPKKPAFKLHERRSSLKNLNISPLMPGFQNSSCCNTGFSPRKPEILSPSLLNFPALNLSPVTPLIPDPFNRSPTTADQAALAEEKAIARRRQLQRKGFTCILRRSRRHVSQSHSFFLCFQ